MAQEDPNQIKIEPDDPEFQLEQHIAFKRRQEAINTQLKRLIPEGLSQFKLIKDGTSFAYTKLNLTNKGLTAITDVIVEYPHLRQLELNSNLFTQITQIQKLSFVTSLNLSRNNIADGKFLSNAGIFPFLKVLNLSNNKLKTLPNLQLVRIQHLNLNFNAIQTLEDFDGHTTLVTLELRGNKISSLKGLAKAKVLKNLYLADNAISSLNGIDSLPLLQRLHLRKNKINDLTAFPKLPALTYLNLRQNQIPKVANLSGIAPTVKSLNLLANPISQELGDNTKKQIWMKYRQYSRINKSEVTSQEREEFDKEYKERLAQQERQQREAREQAEKEAAEKANGE